SPARPAPAAPRIAPRAGPPPPVLPSVIRPIPIAAPAREGLLRRTLRRATGRVLIAFGGLLGMLAAGGFYSSLRGQARRTLEISLILGLCGAVGAALFAMGRALSRPRAWEATAADARPPVLLLRSFGDDRLLLKKQLTEMNMWTFAGQSHMNERTFEE